MCDKQPSFSNVPQGVTLYVSCDASAIGRAPRRITCFRCGEAGHYRGDCRTFRVQMCNLYRLGLCSAGANCTFAHSASELRRPWLSKCVRVVKIGGNVEIQGCGSCTHTFRNCPHHQQICTEASNPDDEAIR